MALSLFTLKDIEVDIVDYTGSHDFQVVVSYVSPDECDIHIHRLDTTKENEGWGEPITLLMSNSITGIRRRIVAGASIHSTKTIREYAVDFGVFTASTHTVTFYSPYDASLPLPPIQGVGREEFNRLFDTDIVVLPSSLYAVGVKDDRGDSENIRIYQYNDAYSGYAWNYEIELTIRHFIYVYMSSFVGSITIDRQERGDFYFIISAHDGYMEGYYPSPRIVPHVIGETELWGKVVVKVEDEGVYPVLHKKHTVLGQSVHPDMNHVIAVPDRYYFCLNRYNLYRSIHGGIPFSQKKNQIVYAGNYDYGSKYNFISRRDIESNQRNYFKNEIVAKDREENRNMIHATGRIEREEMIHYKYILDMDGNTSTWDATAWKLNSGSVILKTRSNWIQWFYSDYREWEHYVPVADDFTDIVEKYRWCEEHPEECLAMIGRCKELFQQVYRFQNVVKYTEGVIRRLM